MSRTPDMPNAVDADPWAGSARSRNREAKRDAILVAAAEAFVSDGYAATSIDDIAARLSVSKPTLYYQVGNKQELLSACFNRALDAYSEAVTVPGRERESARERLHHVIHRYVEITTTVFGRCLHRISDLELTPAVRDRLRDVKRQVDGRIRELIRQGVHEGSLRSADVRMSTFAISGAMNSIAQWYDPAGHLEPDEIAERLWDSFAEGLRPR